MKNNEKGFIPILIALVVAVTVTSGAGYGAYKYNEIQKENKVLKDSVSIEKESDEPKNATTTDNSNGQTVTEKIIPIQDDESDIKVTNPAVSSKEVNKIIENTDFLTNEVKKITEEKEDQKYLDYLNKVNKYQSQLDSINEEIEDLNDDYDDSIYEIKKQYNSAETEYLNRLTTETTGTISKSSFNARISSIERQYSLSLAEIRSKELEINSEYNEEYDELSDEYDAVVKKMNSLSY